MNPVNFVYKVAYWYDGMETTDEKQVFHENTFRENIRYIIIIILQVTPVEWKHTYGSYTSTDGIYRIDVINFAVQYTSTKMKICHDEYGDGDLN